MNRVKPDEGNPSSEAGRLINPADSTFVLDDYLFYNLNHASAQYGEEMEAAFRDLDIDQTAWRVLSLLSEDENSRVGEIARRGMIKVSTLSRRLERMVADGLILKDVGTDDRRTVRVSLTAKGQRELRRAREASAAIFARAIDGIAVDDVAVAISVLKRLRGNLESAGTPVPESSDTEIGNVEA